MMASIPIHSLTFFSHIKVQWLRGYSQDIYCATMAGVKHFTATKFVSIKIDIVHCVMSQAEQLKALSPFRAAGRIRAAGEKMRTDPRHIGTINLNYSQLFVHANAANIVTQNRSKVEEIPRICEGKNHYI
ncbi:hypothetical protein DICVIV_10068 [Dictyocaulus viviparus]|uniref:Uncharacterized protein n=1 Tax=Dictyocaulus viviparus TaxID=29172 RepID=A0A0D8XJH7_DICVI|nr:hypothetical protein DICVIV_10068 [Dictyocaulus viviparus]